MHAIVGVTVYRVCQFESWQEKEGGILRGAASLHELGLIIYWPLYSKRRYDTNEPDHHDVKRLL